VRDHAERGRARTFSVKFYLIAMVFILFDVEAIFLYPWAYIFKDLVHDPKTKMFGFMEMMIYVAILWSIASHFEEGRFRLNKTQK
jgi:NADH:ubiquinone oxidoreductase subunit 3 (subunit A)